MTQARPEDPAETARWEPKRRELECVQRWPECSTGAYDPRCCRFPKSCSADVYADDMDESLLEPGRGEAEKLRDAFLDRVRTGGDLQVLPGDPLAAYPEHALVYIGNGAIPGSRATYQLDHDQFDLTQMPGRDRAIAAALLRLALAKLEAR